jgi:hypothetical protein
LRFHILLTGGVVKVRFALKPQLGQASDASDA